MLDEVGGGTNPNPEKQQQIVDAWKGSQPEQQLQSALQVQPVLLSTPVYQHLTLPLPATSKPSLWQTPAVGRRFTELMSNSGATMAVGG